MFIRKCFARDGILTDGVEDLPGGGERADVSVDHKVGAPAEYETEDVHGQVWQR